MKRRGGNPWLGPLVLLGAGAAIYYLATRPSSGATPPAPAPGPGPNPAPNPAPLPPVLEQGLEQLLAQSANDPNSVDPASMDQFATELDSLGYAAQAAQVRQAAALVRQKRQLPPIPPQTLRAF